MKFPFYVVVVASLVACNSIDVAPVKAEKNPLTKVCIQENPKVKVADFVSVLQQKFDQRGIETVVYRSAMPSSCNYQLTYTALRSWDFAPYLAYAEIRLRKDGRLIGKVDYNHNNGLSLMKWEGTNAKIGPLLDQMLSQFPVAPLGHKSSAMVVEAGATQIGAEEGVATPMSKAEWQKEQLQLLQQSGVSYEEYQRRYREIMQ